MRRWCDDDDDVVWAGHKRSNLGWPCYSFCYANDAVSSTDFTKSGWYRHTRCDFNVPSSYPFLLSNFLPASLKGSTSTLKNLMDWGWVWNRIYRCMRNEMRYENDGKSDQVRAGKDRWTLNGFISRSSVYALYLWTPTCDWNLLWCHYQSSVSPMWFLYRIPYWTLVL